MKRSLTKVSDFDKITVQSNYETKHYKVPPDREVEEQEGNEMVHCDGKGSISFFIASGSRRAPAAVSFDQGGVKDNKTCKIR